MLRLGRAPIALWGRCWGFPRAYAVKKKQKKKPFDEYPIESIRNIGIIAHVDAGKTTTAERMLYLAGEINHMGDVDSGNTKMDFLEMERERGITIQSAAISFIWNDCRVNMIDTPGHVDFQGEVERSVRVLDGAVAILDAVHGVQAQTHTIWRQADRYQVPRIVFFNKMDRDDASVDRGIHSLQERLGAENLVPLQIPVGSAEFFQGVIDIVEKKSILWPRSNEIDNYTETEVTNSHPSYQKMMKMREELLTKLADHDDNIIEAYTEHGDQVDAKTIHASIRKLVAQSLITPVLCGSSFKCKGVQPLLDAIIRYLPAPHERPPVIAQSYLLTERVPLPTTMEVIPDPADYLVALAFKVVHDIQKGMVVYVRLYRGYFHCGMKLHNINRNLGERVVTLMRIGGESLTLINSIKAGDICALVGMKEVHTGDTLIASGDMKRFKRKAVPLLSGIQIPPPVFSCAIEAADERKEAHLLLSLENLAKEDPSFRFTTDKETGQLLISGMGELHLEILKDRLLNHYNVEATVGKMRVSYRTSLCQEIQKEFEYLYELTGTKQRATVTLKLAPLLRAEDEDQLQENEVTLDIPSTSWDHVPYDVQGDIKDALREGVENVLRCGPMYSFPVHGVHATVLNIGFHEDSTPSAFRACVSRMMRDMLKESAMSVLQPVMQVEVSVPEQFFGNILSDISNYRRGNIQRVEDGSNAKEKIVSAEVPLRAMMGYSTAVRSISQGTASFTMDFLRYGDLPENEIEALHKEYRGF